MKQGILTMLSYRLNLDFIGVFRETRDSHNKPQRHGDTETNKGRTHQRHSRESPQSNPITDFSL